MNQRFFLIGLPGSGKSTYGKQLADDLGYLFLDLDQEIVKSEKRVITDIFSRDGETKFREIEKHYLNEMIQSHSTFVMATGGGTPCFYDNLDVMKTHGFTVFIDTPMEIIKERLKNDQSRPLMQSKTLESLYKERKSWYLQAHKTAKDFEELIKVARP